MRGLVRAIDPVDDDLFPRMFTNVHEIVHNTFLSLVNGTNAVRTWADDVFEFYVSEIFVNNWTILIFVYLF